MGAFSTYDTAPTTPPGTVMVPVLAWSHTWDDRPREPVMAGLRPLSEADLVFCRTEALRIVDGWYPGAQVDAMGEVDRIVAYNDALMRLGVSRGTCDPNNVREAWDVWGRHGGDELVREALTVEGTKMLWDALERTTMEVSPVLAAATDEEIAELTDKAARALTSMPKWQAQRVRRLLRFCLDTCVGALGEPPVV